MARKEVVLITGANGEVGHGLIEYLAERGEVNIVALDVHPLDKRLRPYCQEMIVGDVLDTMMLGRLVFEYEIR
ncbi:MAG: epimerase, partial [Chloroflexi bacterium]|nr:epimerase [Chloroflexota bacterium]NLH07768.1 epimerase [Chloroflexota bacterium]